MELLAGGRDADVFALSASRVVRRYRDGRDAHEEAVVIRRLNELGYAAPHLFDQRGPDLVMERVRGPTLVSALEAGAVSLEEVSAMLAALHHQLHALPWPGAGSGEAFLHLDLHPNNVLLRGPGDPVVVDWTNGRVGPADADAAMTALILAQVAIGDPPQRDRVEAVLAGFASALGSPYAAGMPAAVAFRRRDRYQTQRELAQLDEAAELAVSHSVAAG